LLGLLRGKLGLLLCPLLLHLFRGGYVLVDLRACRLAFLRRWRWRRLHRTDRSGTWRAGFV
jgi:uncharacterized Fe-S cluster-containing radical SAM superfamily protein